MRTIELFSGTASFSRVAKELGHSIETYDNSPDADDLGNHHTADVAELNLSCESVDILWASPPCQAFSVAAMGRNWVKETREPKTDRARDGMKLLRATIGIIANMRPRFWFIENPRGFMRKKIDPLFSEYGIKDYKRETVTYCQYGDTRMKPTDIWTNCREWTPRPMCKNGAPCHEAAPRGARTGTQGMKGARERSVIPPELFREIFGAIGD